MGSALIGLLVEVAMIGALYPLAIYPALVVLLARLRPRPWQTGPIEGHIAHVITVHNEQGKMRAKLENALALRVPPGCTLETIVASDGSTDATDPIVREYEPRGVRLVACPRRGKEYAQLEAIASTKAPCIVFSDAAATIEPDALAPILAPFHDPRVHAVSGTDLTEESAEGTGEAIYVRYEMAVRRAESLAGSLIGLSGCFFAARRENAVRWNPRITSDMGAALVAIEAGGRAVAADGARCIYRSTPRIGDEVARKRRTALRGLRCLWVLRRATWAAGPIVAWQILSHKWSRFLVPVWIALAVLGVLVAGALSPNRVIWAEIVLGGALVAGILGLVRPRLRRSRPIRVIGFVLMSMFAVLLAWKDFLEGEDGVRWIPTQRE